MSAVCPVCDNPQDQGLACHACVTRLERELASVRELMGELDVSISKMARIGNAGAPGLARERSPINVGAMMAADDLTNTLTTWARDVTGGRWAISLDAAPRLAAPRILLASINEIRRHPAVSELVDEILDAIRTARRAIDRPQDRVYLGQCLVETPDDQGRLVTCLADIFAKPNASTATCRTCGITHEVIDRRTWLLEKAADMLVTPKEASSYLGEVAGIKVTQASIRGLLHRGTRLQYRAPVEAKRFRLGDLLDVLIESNSKDVA